MNAKSIFGLVILALVAIVVYVVQSGDQLEFLEKREPVEEQIITGFVGGEKTAFLRDPEVVSILKDRYGITFDATKAGSIEMVTTLPTEGKSCLWPSNQVAVELFRLRGGSPVGQETLFNSPIVLYTWDIVADALAAEGFVQERGGVHYLVDFAGLVRKVVDGTEWKDVGLPQLYGKMRIFSTDPRRSNSGNMFSGLLINMLNDGEVATETELAELLPSLTGYFERMGYMEHSSGDIFENFLETGVGAKPIIVGYESQLIGYAIEHADHRQLLEQRIRTLYPVPTVWSSHPLIALDDSCKDLIAALEDADIQRLAWERHGFRSGLIGVENDPTSLPVSGVPLTIDAVMPMPGAAVMQRIVEELR